MTKFNWRVLLIHFMASWLFMQAFSTLSFLHNLHALQATGHPSQPNNESIASGIYWVYIPPYVGLLVAFFISLFISIRKHWYWWHSVIVFVICYLLRRFEMDGWELLRHVFLKPGSFFPALSFGYLFINGMTMLVLAMLLFFSKFTNRFIAGKNSNN